MSRCDGLVECGTHGAQLPGFIVCVHVLEGQPVVHYVEVAHDLGEALCGECAAVAELESAILEIDPDYTQRLGDLRVVCSACLTERMGAWRGCMARPRLEGTTMAADTKKCPTCGMEIASNKTVCPVCGAKQ